MTSYWLLLMAPFFISLELGDSSLVILSPCSLAPFFVISIFSFSFLSSFSVIFISALWFSAWGSIFFFNIHLYYLSKKKNKGWRLSSYEAQTWNNGINISVRHMLNISMLETWPNAIPWGIYQKNILFILDLIKTWQRHSQRQNLKYKEQIEKGWRLNY